MFVEGALFIFFIWNGLDISQLTEYDVCLFRFLFYNTLFILVKPDCWRLVKESDFVFVYNTSSSTITHHEEAHSNQIKLHKDVLLFVETLKQMGKPFLATSTELVSLDTQDVMGSCCIIFC